MEDLEGDDIAKKILYSTIAIYIVGAALLFCVGYIAYYLVTY